MSKFKIGDKVRIIDKEGARGINISSGFDDIYEIIKGPDFNSYEDCIIYSIRSKNSGSWRIPEDMINFEKVSIKNIFHD